MQDVSPLTVVPPPPHPVAHEPVPPATRRQRIELAVFILLLVPSLLPVMVRSVAPQAFALTSVVTILHDLALVGLVLYFVWTNGERRSDIGWTTAHAGREVVVGVVLYIPMFFGLILLQRLLAAVGVTSPTETPGFLTPTSGFDTMLAVALVIVVAIAEETVFRGYLLLRLRAITHSTTAAVVIAALLFASGHAYEGTAGMIAVAAMGVWFAVVYLWRRSLIAAIVMHFLQDFLGIVLVPLLAVHH